MATTFKFRAGTRIKGLAASAAAAELERVRAERGGLTPEAVVEAAADATNPLHPAFEWNDSKAAHEHRLGQARGLIRAVITVEAGKTDAPLYVHVSVDNERQYLPAAVVASSPGLYAAAMAELQGHLRAAHKAVADLRRLAPESEVPSAVERLLEEAGELAKAA